MPYLVIFGQKYLILVFFGQKYKKTIVTFEISTLEFVKNESLTDTMNFGIGSTFSEGLGPLYKVCSL